MEIYNERMERIEHPDLTKGWLMESRRTVHHEAVAEVKEVWHYETIAQYENGGRDVQRVIDVEGVEGRDAWDEEIAIQIYRPYTSDELKAMQEQVQRPNAEERLAQMEVRLKQMEAQLTQICRKMELTLERITGGAQKEGGE